MLIFLGIEIDTVAGQIRLPQEKPIKLQTSVKQWMQPQDRSLPRRSGQKRDLLSLIGLLHHATKVVRPGRAFLRNLINAAASVSALDHHVHLTPAAKAGGTVSFPSGMTRTHSNVSDKSKADYSVYVIKDQNQFVVAVLVETKLTSNIKFQHALAQPIELFGVGALAPFSLAGHWLLFEI